MNKLNAQMKRIVAEQKLGFVATVSEDGTPNLSPKATCLVLDDDRIIFGNLRSPNTVENVSRHPAMEINFVDPFARKGFRAKGAASYFARGTPEFDALLPRFSEWGDLAQRLKGIFALRVEHAAILTSPAYDIGAKEGELRETWLDYFTRLQENR